MARSNYLRARHVFQRPVLDPVPRRMPSWHPGLHWQLRSGLREHRWGRVHRVANPGAMRAWDGLRRRSLRFRLHQHVLRSRRPVVRWGPGRSLRRLELRLLPRMGQLRHLCAGDLFQWDVHRAMCRRLHSWCARMQRNRRPGLWQHRWGRLHGMGATGDLREWDLVPGRQLCCNMHHHLLDARRRHLQRRPNPSLS